MGDKQRDIWQTTRQRQRPWPRQRQTQRTKHAHLPAGWARAARWASQGKQAAARRKWRAKFWKHRQPSCWQREAELWAVRGADGRHQHVPGGGDQIQRTTWGSHSQAKVATLPFQERWSPSSHVHSQTERIFARPTEENCWYPHWPPILFQTARSFPVQVKLSFVEVFFILF